MTRRRVSLTAVVVGLVATLAGVDAAAVDVPGSQALAVTTDLNAEAAPGHPAVLSQRIIGYSVRGHAIRAYELGERSASRTVVAVASMHGNEQDGGATLSTLVNGRPIEGVHLWVVPRSNPDGVLQDRRHNARGVDLNRNYPRKWKPLTGYYYAGPRPRSEPETRTLIRFLNRVDPDYVVSFHSPLRGIDAYGSKDPPFARRLARNLGLPVKEFDCSGVCHGTLTQWFNAYHRGACVTVEFSGSPTYRYVHVRAPRGLVRAIGGTFG